MAPKGKSSASSATRKKHARKAAAALGVVEEIQMPKEKQPKGKDKKSKKEPRKKVYIPPVKPAPIQPDPLDTLGLAQKLPPELLVVLRLLSKKDATTKRRALEDLQAWVGRANGTDRDPMAEHALQQTMPVWLHHLPTLFLHPSRRIRLTAIGLHKSILQIQSLRDELFFQIREVMSSDQAESVLGSWCLAVHDVDRQVSSFARDAWHWYVSTVATRPGTFTLDSTFLPLVWNFVQRTLLDPAGVYSYINPAQPIILSPTPGKRGAGRGVPVRKDEETSPRPKADEDEENEQDRKARLRVGAFGATEWVLSAKYAKSLKDKEVAEKSDNDSTSSEDFLGVFRNPALWTSLYHGKSPPFVDIESFGFEQPIVRRSAWSLLQTILQRCRGQIDSLFPVLSVAILRSAWVEVDPNVRAAMWQPLLVFLKEYPIAWSLAAQSEREEDEDEDDDERDTGDGDSPQTMPSKPTADNLVVPSHAFTEFLQFLSTGCSGSPIQGYPTVLIILSTIPSCIISATSSHPVEDLFTAFWAAVDARVLNTLDRVAASTAFLSSLLECLVFMIRRIIASSEDDAASLLSGKPADGVVDVHAAVKIFLQDQTNRTWEELSSGRLKVYASSAGKELATMFTSLYKLRSELFQTAWEVLASQIKGSISSTSGTIPAVTPELLRQLSTHLQSGTVPGDAATDLVNVVIRAALDQVSVLLDAEEKTEERSASLIGILDTFGHVVFTDERATQSVDELVQRQTFKLFTAMPSLLMLYFKHREDEAACLSAWHKVLEAVASRTDESESILSALLSVADSGTLPSYLHPQGEELHEVVTHLLTEAISGPPNAIHVSLIGKLLKSFHYFISSSCRDNVLRGLVDAFVLHFDSVLHDQNAPVNVFVTPLTLLRGLVDQEDSVLLQGSLAMSLFPYIYLYGYLLPLLSKAEPAQHQVARDMWHKWYSVASPEVKQNTLAVLAHLLRELTISCLAIPDPSQVLQALSMSGLTADIDVMNDVFPSQTDLSGMLDSLPSIPLDPSLAVVDPLVPPPTLYRLQKSTTTEYDHRGFSVYARIVHGLLLYLVDDRHAAKQNIWALHHFLALAIYAEELSQLPSTSSAVFAQQVSPHYLQEIQDRVQQLTAYLLSSTADEQWHTTVTGVLAAQSSAGGLDGVGRLVVDLVNRAKRFDTVRDSRILHVILRHAFSTATKTDAEQWMMVARKLEKSAPHTSLAIIYSLTRYAPQSTRLDRFRNELAAGTLGIPASKANTEGLWLLRNLAAAAPDPNSDVVFLPQTRAVNLIKACQQWIASDEDLEEDVQSEMTLVFTSLVPILSNVPGAHWDLVFDVIENNLENASLDDSSTYVSLSRTLSLFLVLEEYAASNKTLKASWEERRLANLTLIRDLVSLKLDTTSNSSPLSTCRELALQIVQDLPASLLTKETLPKMSHLVLDGSVVVQRMAYQLLQGAAKRYTEELVIEAAVDTEGTMKSELPTELMDILQRDLFHEGADEYGQECLGYLLTWMIAFDMFGDASLKVKSGYIDQLRDNDLVGSRLLPVVFGILDLYGGVAKAFKLDIWDVDEFYLELYSTDTPLSLRLLTAHLYYRALLVVPSLIRNWLVDCRDRQLSSTVASYTSRHFSPAIIRTELAVVKDPHAAAELSGENVTIKVASAVNEVTASYVVDEQKLELTVKLPADWPLHTIEIRESKLVGVTEDRWRAWVLGVQQILTFRSGSIVDGLSFFLKNVTSHFEGLAECAICYSIVNATDGTLPRKPCKTCKNRFHAACLYKWFNTSHSSSCPLCRSEIMTGK